jgi:hypothetical protein
LDCSSSQHHFINRHNAVRDTLVQFIDEQVETASGIHFAFPKEPRVIPRDTPSAYSWSANHAVGREALAHAEELRTGPRQTIAEFRTARAQERQDGTTRADAGFQCAYGRKYIDVAIANPAAPSYLPGPTTDPSSGELILPAAGASNAITARTNEKKARYRPILGDDVDNFGFFVAFVVEATGRFSPDALKLSKFIISDSRSKNLLHNFCTQVGGAIARYNAMAASAWVLSLARSPSLL